MRGVDGLNVVRGGIDDGVTPCILQKYPYSGCFLTFMIQWLHYAEIDKSSGVSPSQ